MTTEGNMTVQPKETDMWSELECGVCYRSYNGGQRCPRELRCKHSFCEVCLVALARPQTTETPSGACVETGKTITCPLCRHVTFVSADVKVRAALPVDEGVLERMIVAGFFEKDDDAENERSHKEPPAVVIPVEEADTPPGSGSWGFRWPLKRVLRRSTYSRNERNRANRMTNEDIRHFALMSTYMF